MITHSCSQAPDVEIQTLDRGSRQPGNGDSSEIDVALTGPHRRALVGPCSATKEALSASAMCMIPVFTETTRSAR